VRKIRSLHSIFEADYTCIMHISVVIITYNEANNIERCLQSVKTVADEVVVLDSHSTDTTIEICTRIGAKVFLQPFAGHIEQKNAATLLAQFDWLLSLDADEALSEDLTASILAIKQKNQSPSGIAFAMNRRNLYAGQWVRHGGWYPDRKVRLWHKADGQWGGLNPHDKVILKNEVQVELLKGDLTHHAYTDATAHREKAKKYAAISAQAKWNAGKRSNWALVYLAPAWRFVQAYFLQLGCLDGTVGWQIATISALEKYWKYRMLLKMR
jgi:glycosyltransferase involved in cell wall biosynthesis